MKNNCPEYSFHYTYIYIYAGRCNILLLLRLLQGDPCKRQHPFRVGGKDLEGRRSVQPKAPPQPEFDFLRHRENRGFVKDLQRLGYAFSWCVSSTWGCAPTRLLIALQMLVQDKSPYTSIVPHVGTRPRRNPGSELADAEAKTLPQPPVTLLDPSPTH